MHFRFTLIYFHKLSRVMIPVIYCLSTFSGFGTSVHIICLYMMKLDSSLIESDSRLVPVTYSPSHQPEDVTPIHL